MTEMEDIVGFIKKNKKNNSLIGHCQECKHGYIDCLLIYNLYRLKVSGWGGAHSPHIMAHPLTYLALLLTSLSVPSLAQDEQCHFSLIIFFMWFSVAT
jgi:hypothetical protein